MAQYGRSFPPSTQTSHALVEFPALGVGTGTLAMVTVDSQGTPPITGSAAFSLPMLTLDGAAGIVGVITGTAAITLPMETVTGATGDVHTVASVTLLPGRSQSNDGWPY